MTRIPYIALCGWPKVGKSLVSELLQDIYGIVPVDDGRPLRDACKILYGLTEEQVTTQEGKASYVEVCGQMVQVRELLGELGNALEGRHGEQIVPEMALKMVERIRPQFHDMARFCFPSVRKTQGLTYKRHGGIVVNIQRKGTEPSPYAFDRFDPSLVDFTIKNDFDTPAALRKHLVSVFDIILGGE